MSTQMISQETFDEVVQENMEEFDMDPEDALREAVEQFVSQGVNLSFIVKAIPTASSDGKQEGKTHEVLRALESLRVGQHSGNITAELKRFTDQCSLGFPQRYLAAQKGAYPVILSYCRNSLEDQGHLLVALAALAVLTDGQPDLLDNAGTGLLVSILRRYQADPAVTRAALRTVRHCCLKHEQNRLDLVAAGVLPLMTGAICKHSRCAELVKEASAGLKFMTFDDDVRVPFGRAHDHARLIVTQHCGLKVIIEAAKAHRDKIPVVGELCATLARLAVRNEFCQDICDLGGLKLLMTLLADSFEAQEVVRQALGAIRAVAGNDDVKDAVVSAGGVQLVVVAMNAHMSNANVCEQGCGCLSVLALRKPDNCQVIMDKGGAMAAVQAMRAHPRQVNVQKQACMLVRNLVAHANDFSQPILQMGAEDLICEALRSYQEDCGDVCRAALRDLGCRVELRELWTGEKGTIAN